MLRELEDVELRKHARSSMMSELVIRISLKFASTLSPLVNNDALLQEPKLVRLVSHSAPEWPISQRGGRRKG